MPADTLTREEKIDRWVVLSAASSLVANLMSTLDAFPGFTGDDVGVLTPEESELFYELWPNDEDEECAEHLTADARAQALMAGAFATLASDEMRERCLTEAARHALRAANPTRLRVALPLMHGGGGR